VADLFDRYGVAPSGGGDLFDRYAGGEGGGVQDWEPSQQPTEPTIGERVNRGVNWLGTRATKAATSLLGTPRVVGEALEMVPPEVRALVPGIDIPRLVGQALPSKQQMDAFVFRDLKVPEVDSAGPTGKIIDAAAEAAIPTVIMPGSVARNVLPAFAGGGASEFAGQLTEGTRWEPFARIGAGVGVGVGTGLAQNALGNVLQGIRNFIAPNVKESAAKIIARNIERDATTGNALADAQRANPGSLLVENAGPNVRGALRGSTAAPGSARTTAQDAFDARIEGTNKRTTNALDSAISPNSSLAASVDELNALRAQQATPKYEAAGIPRKIEKTETIRPGDPVKKTVPILPGAKARTQIEVPGPDVVERTFNSPNFSTPELDYYLKRSPDVQAAIAAARRLPQFQELPDNSMVMLDKAYKHLVGMEQEAIRAGNGTRAFDLKNLRQGFQKALTDANPKYQEALDAYSTPSKLIDASERAKEWFTKNVDPIIVTREFEAMKAAGLDDAALIGVRDWARTVIGRSDRGVAAERVWSGGDNRARLESILGPGGFKKLQSVMESEKNLIRTQRDVGVGSRTTPMALEAADNALESVGPVTDLLRGNVLSAAGKFGGRLAGRIAEGRTEATNAEIARMLTSTDPAEVGLVAALLEQARLRELARSSGRMNALAYGGTVAPTINALGDMR
jgi:hypothetical protein